MSKFRSRRSLCILAGSVAVAAACGIGGFLQGRVAADDAAAAPAAETAFVKAESAVAAGRYLVKVGGCNDCHTPGAMRGNLPAEAQWLTGVPVGFRGPWGTSYASNLRLFVKDLKEDDFVGQMGARHDRPPMPWGSLHAMSDPDLRAVYQYIKFLRPAGKPMPEAVPPGEEPKTPYVSFAPVVPPGVQPPG